jgi:hypothetical protein
MLGGAVKRTMLAHPKRMSRKHLRDILFGYIDLKKLLSLKI